MSVTRDPGPSQHDILGQILTSGDTPVQYRLKHNNDPKQPQFFTSNNIALNRKRFLELGGFDARFPSAAGEDRELCRRWLNTGYAMHYQPSAVIHHAHNLSLSGFWQQHLNYGRGAYRFRTHNSTRLTFEPLSFYVNLMHYPFQRANGRTAIRLFILFAIMQLANTFGFLREKYGGFGT